MKKGKKNSIRIAVVALLLGALAGCRSNDSENQKMWVSLDDPFTVILDNRISNEQLVDTWMINGAKYYKIDEKGNKATLTFQEDGTIEYIDSGKLAHGFVDKQYVIISGGESQETSHTKITFVGSQSIFLEDGPLSGTYVFQESLDTQ